MKIQFKLTVARRKFVFGQLEVGEPLQELRLKDLLLPVEGVTGEPDHLLLREAELARMVQLFPQLGLVDLVGKANRLVAVDQGESRVDIAIKTPDHLKHKQFVEVGIQQASADRVQLPGVIVDAACDIRFRHPGPACRRRNHVSRTALGGVLRANDTLHP